MSWFFSLIRRFSWQRDILPALIYIHAFFAFAMMVFCFKLALEFVPSPSDLGHCCDFFAYYTAATIYVKDLGNIYDLELYKTLQALFQHVPLKDQASLNPLPFLNPPHAVFPFVPLAVLPIRLSYVVWMTINLALSIVFIVCIIRYFDIRNGKLRFLAAALILGNVYWVQSMYQGQMTLLLSIALIGLLSAWKKEKKWLAAFCLLILAMKPHLFFMLSLPVVFSLPVSFLVAAVVAFAICAIVIAFMFTPLIFMQFWELLSKANFSSKEYSAVFENMPMLRGLLFFCFGNSHAQSFEFYAMLFLLFVFVLIWLWVKKHPSPGTPAFEILVALTLVCNFFISPWMHTYDLLLLAVPVCVLLRYLIWQDNRAVYLAIAIYAAFLSYSLYSNIILMLLLIVGLTWVFSMERKKL